jgi:MinD-like ATPase involved in chromosome partitioning or flagellar assembly
VGHSVVVAGGKGGVGVSTASALLAFGAAASGRNTLLVDATPSGRQQRDLLSMPEQPDVAPRSSPAFRRVTVRLTLAETPDAAALTPTERRSLLRRVSTQYDDYDFVVIDAGCTAELVSSALSTGSGRLLAVSANDRLSIVATYALVKYMLERFAELPTSVLINRCDPAMGSSAFARIAEGVTDFLGCSIAPAGTLPDDESIRAAAEAGASLFTADGPAVLAAKLLAELLLARPARPGRATVQIL